MLDDPSVLLRNAREESGHVFEGHDGNIEAVAEAHKARAFQGAVDVQNAGEIRRLVGDDANRTPIQTRKAHDDVQRIVAMDFKEVTIVNYQIDHFANVVRLVRCVGHD